MAYQEHRIVYRQQFETANINTGVVNREYMEACYIVVMVDADTGNMIPTNKMGIIRIPLAKYPQLQVSVEGFVPMFIDAFEQEYQEEQNRLEQSELEQSELEQANQIPPDPLIEE